LLEQTNPNLAWFSKSLRNLDLRQSIASLQTRGKNESKEARENSEEERDTSQETIRTIHEGMAEEKAHGSGRKEVPMP
jgi:hypothetical protein